MQSLTCLHPDLENFIKIKRDKTKVTGSNISVMITDEFMKAVEEGTDFILRFPTDKPIPEHINTSKLEYDVLFYDEVSDMYFKRIDAERIFKSSCNRIGKEQNPVCCSHQNCWTILRMEFIRNIALYRQTPAASNRCPLTIVVVCLH